MQLKDPGPFKTKCLIGGEWVDEAGGATITVRNPADDSVIGTVSRLGRKETAKPLKARKAWSAPGRR